MNWNSPKNPKFSITSIRQLPVNRIFRAAKNKEQA